MATIYKDICLLGVYPDDIYKVNDAEAEGWKYNGYKWIGGFKWLHYYKFKNECKRK